MNLGDDKGSQSKREMRQKKSDQGLLPDHYMEMFLCLTAQERRANVRWFRIDLSTHVLQKDQLFTTGKKFGYQKIAFARTAKKPNTASINKSNSTLNNILTNHFSSSDPLQSNLDAKPTSP